MASLRLKWTPWSRPDWFVKQIFLQVSQVLWSLPLSIHCQKSVSHMRNMRNTGDKFYMELYEHTNSKISWTVSTYDFLCCLNIINQVFRLKFFRKLKFCLQGSSFPSKTNASFNSTGAHPPPPGQPLGICSGSMSWSVAFVHLGGIPGNLIHKV